MKKCEVYGFLGCDVLCFVRYQRFGGIRYISLQGRRENIRSDMDWMKVVTETRPLSYVILLLFLFPWRAEKLPRRRR